MPRIRKKSSKRQTLKQKYKVERKVREHNRKQKRDQRKNPQKRSKLKKDPGIPNLWPYKEEMLLQMKAQKERMDDDRARTRERLREKQREDRMADSIADIAARAEEEQRKYERRQQRIAEEERLASKGLNFADVPDQTKKQFYKEFRKVVESSDVVLEVLDARDPLGCRCRTAERQLLAQDPNKRIVLVLNKIDLVPPEVAQAWLQFLRREYPTVAFKCNTSRHGQRKHLGVSEANAETASAGQRKAQDALGAVALLELLKTYSLSAGGMKKAITVGVVGYPNVGKSSLINSMRRERVVETGSTAGVTRHMQEIALDRKVKLLDCPGIVFASGRAREEEGGAAAGVDEATLAAEMEQEAAAIMLRNCVRVEDIADPLIVVDEILRRCPPAQLQQIYDIGRFDGLDEFLALVARRGGMLKRGGTPRVEDAARLVLRNWNSGKIPYYTVPPEGPSHGSAAAGEAVVVAQWAPEFNLDDFYGAQDSAVLDMMQRDDEGPSTGAIRPMQVALSSLSLGGDHDRGFIDGAANGDWEEEGDWEDDGEEMCEE